jgi:hypothetical protein
MANKVVDTMGLVLHEALEVRYETLNGDRYLVAPVVAMVEGVHHGSGGPWLYPANELEAFVQTWNGVPLPVQHPERGGQSVTANQPEVLETQVVGQFFNVYYDQNKRAICGEVWIDVNKAATIAPTMIAHLKAGRPLEVSTGLYSDGDETPGTWNGEDYIGIVQNIHPDHLALLPGGVGACSWEDGCGVRANMKINELSHQDIWLKLQQKIDTIDNDSWVHYVRDVFDGYFVYTARGSNPSEGTPGEVKMYRQNYTIDNEEVSFTGDPEEVREERTYVEVSNNSNTTKEVTMDKEKVIKDLIENKANLWTPCDKEFLEGLDDDKLTKMSTFEEPEVKPDEIDNAPDKPDAAPEEKSTAPEDAPEKKPKDKPEATENNEQAEANAHALALLHQDKTILIKSLTENSRCSFTEDELKSKPLPELEKLAAMVEVPVDYSGRGGAKPVTDNEGPPAPKLVWPEKKTDSK